MRRRRAILVRTVGVFGLIIPALAVMAAVVYLVPEAFYVWVAAETTRTIGLVVAVVAILGLLCPIIMFLMALAGANRMSTRMRSRYLGVAGTGPNFEIHLAPLDLYIVDFGFPLSDRAKRTAAAVVSADVRRGLAALMAEIRQRPDSAQCRVIAKSNLLADAIVNRYGFVQLPWKPGKLSALSRILAGPTVKTMYAITGSGARGPMGKYELTLAAWDQARQPKVSASVAKPNQDTSLV